VKFYEAEADIQASPEAIWKLLTSASQYPSWNTTVDRVEGSIEPGQTIKVFVKVNPGRSFPVKVTTFEPGRRMVWSGGMPLGLFKGERTYDLAPPRNGVVHFKMREEYTGPMLGMIWKSIPDLGPAFIEFAQSLKSAAEKASTS
jgi:hypothetical protein